MATFIDDNSWRPTTESDRYFPPAANPKVLDDNKTIADHLRRGDANFSAYPPETHPLLARAFAHWNDMWALLFGDPSNTEELEFAAGQCVSSAWRIYLGRCVRWKDVDFDGSLGEDHPFAVRFFPTRRDDHRWWFTEDGYKQSLDWLRQGKWDVR